MGVSFAEYTMPIIYDVGCLGLIDAIGSWGGGTHDSVYGDDFAEDDAGVRFQFQLQLLCGRRDGGGGEYLIKFLVVIRGALTPPPRIEAPVMNMPLRVSS